MSQFIFSEDWGLFGFQEVADASPVLTEDRIVQHNLFQQLNEFIGEVGRHESLHRDGYFLWILSL